jgi:type VI secretion system protein VasI
MKRRYLCSIIFILTFVVPCFLGGQQEDIKKKLAQCAQVKGDLERLECYDRLARELGLFKTATTVPIKGAGKWVTSTDKNPLDDTRTVVLSLIADEGKSKMGEDITLFLRCKSNKTELYISWSDYLGMGSTQVITRVGNASAQRMSWGLSTDSTATFFPGSPISFVKSLMNVDKLVVQVTPYSESPVTAVFDVRGLGEAIKQLQETCGWN